MVEKSKNKVWVIIKWIIVIAVLLFLVFGLRGCFGVGLDYESPTGQGKYSQSFGNSFLEMLGVSRIPDWVDEVSGEEYCFNYDCNVEASLLYEECLDAVMLRIGVGGFDPEADCWRIYEETLFGDCVESCDDEVFAWDGTSVDDVGTFFGYAYPNAVRSWKDLCESWLFDGEWVQETGRVGCVNGRFLGCDSRSVVSGGDVCTQIGYAFVCGDGENIICE